jgi:Methylmalonyl-CoA mutase, N-terminal domain/subunit
MDETLALPSEHAVTLALRTQQVLAYETGVTNTVDPLGGSYFVESFTRQMEQQARTYFRKIEEHGGMIRPSRRAFSAVKSAMRPSPISARSTPNAS